MKHDFRDTIDGDWGWTSSTGWAQIRWVRTAAEHLIIIDGDSRTFNMDGYHNDDDKYPSIFISPPEGYGAKPKPTGSEFKQDCKNKGKCIMEWISVEDSKPDLNENVLCWMDGKIAINCLVHDEVSYLHYTDRLYHDNIKKNTTFWMKLPPGPIVE